jgi:hypothetical protein
MMVGCAAGLSRRHAERWIASRIGYDRLAMELDLCMGIAFLKQGDFTKATNVFRVVERQELDLHDQAACNLSFLYYLEGDHNQARKYADLAIQENRCALILVSVMVSVNGMWTGITLAQW